MTNLHNHPRDELSALLREGDPAKGAPPLSEHETAAMRHRIVAAAQAVHTSPALRWSLAACAAAIAMAALLVIPAVLDPTEPPPTTPAVQTARQVQFVTPGGTRVYWFIERAPEPEETKQ